MICVLDEIPLTVRSAVDQLTAGSSELTIHPTITCFSGPRLCKRFVVLIDDVSRHPEDNGIVYTVESDLKNINTRFVKVLIISRKSRLKVYDANLYTYWSSLFYQLHLALNFDHTSKF